MGESKLKVLAMIPARMGSQRLKYKNLKEINGKSLLEIAINKCKDSGIFDEVWVNSESEQLGEFAKKNKVGFHKRPHELAGNDATSEDFIYEFLTKHECSHVVQVHSIAPLLAIDDIRQFTEEVKNSDANVFLSCESIQIECAFNNEPINFVYEKKTNSQFLSPVQRISWAITGWRKEEYIKYYELGACATYSGKVKYIPVNKLANHVIKYEEDLEIARLLFSYVNR